MNASLISHHITMDSIAFKNYRIFTANDFESDIGFSLRLCQKWKYENLEDAFFLMNIDALLERIHLWQVTLPAVKPYYAVKAHPDDLMLEVLAAHDVNFDCASKVEIGQVLGLDVAPERIIYAHTIKSPKHLGFARENDVRLMTFDNEYELIKIRDCFPEAKLLLRINVVHDDPSTLVRLTMVQKFGAEPTEVAPYLLERAAELGLSVEGVCFHVGTASTRPFHFAEGIKEAKVLFEIGKKLGHPMKIVDIGGGFPGLVEDNDHFYEIANVIKAAISDHFPDENDVTFAAEPGRFFAASSFSLLVSVVGKRKITPPMLQCPPSPVSMVSESSGVTDMSLSDFWDETGQSHDDKVEFMYFTNDGLHGSFTFNKQLGAKLPTQGIPLIITQSDPDTPVRKMSSSILWGPTCSADMIADNMVMPELNIGDWLYFPNMGAYTRSLGGNFNGFPTPDVHYMVTQKNSYKLMSAISQSAVMRKRAFTF